MKEYYGGGSGSDPTATDCFETAFDHYMAKLGMTGPGFYNGDQVVSGYDAMTGSNNAPEDGGVNGSNYDDVLHYGAVTNFMQETTGSGCDIAQHYDDNGSGSDSGVTQLTFDAIGAFNDPNGDGSHAVNITGMHKGANGEWYVDYTDYQNDPSHSKEKLASQMIKITMFSPLDSGSGSGS